MIRGLYSTIGIFFVTFITSFSLSSSLPIHIEEGVNSLSVDRLSYCSPVDIKKFNCEDCNDRTLIGLYDPPSKASSQAVVVYDDEDNEILVGFRGTINKISQWASDLDTVYTRWKYGNGNVHSGFYDRFDEIKAPVMSFLRIAKKIHPKASIIVSGHSMGGAVATMFSMYLDTVYPSYSPSFVYTFGSPRVGDKTFATQVDKTFGDKLIRVMNEWDMVTDLPPTAFGYRHTGKLISCVTGTLKCTEYGRLDENKGGLLMALKRVVKTAEDVNLCHLTYLDDTIGSKRYKC